MSSIKDMFSFQYFLDSVKDWRNFTIAAWITINGFFFRDLLSLETATENSVFLIIVGVPVVAFLFLQEKIATAVFMSVILIVGLLMLLFWV